MKNLILTMICSLMLNTNANSQLWNWVNKIESSTQLNVGGAIGKDNSNNSYIAGNFSGSATFGSCTLNSIGTSDFFIAKYDITGACLWVQHGGGANSNVHVASIVTDGIGNSYVTGNFNGTVTFGTQVISSTGPSDIFMVRYSPLGAVQWLRRYGSDGLCAGLAITLDPSSNVLLTGYFSSNVNFGGTSLTSSGLKDAFLAKYGSNGILQWVIKGGGANDDVGNSVKTDAFGNVYATGTFQNTAQFLGQSLTSSGDRDIFVTKINSNGQGVWIIKGGGTNTDIANNLELDGAGNVYVTGSFIGTLTFSPLVISGDPVNEDMFLVKIVNNGTSSWITKVGGPGAVVGMSVTTDNVGDSYVTGYFSQTIDFGQANYTSNGLKDVFLVKYRSNGDFIDVKVIGGIGEDTGLGLNCSNSGQCNIFGSFENNITIDNWSLNSTVGSKSIFFGDFNGLVLSVTESNTMLSDFMIYPNPFNDQITISFESKPENEYFIKILDHLGRIIHDQLITGHTYKLEQIVEMQNYQSGVYFISIDHGIDSKYMKIVKL